MGYVHGALCCERVTTAICHGAKVQCNADLEPYIDDMGAGTTDNLEKATKEFNDVCNLVLHMGLDLAVDKCVGPSHVMS